MERFELLAAPHPEREETAASLTMTLPPRRFWPHLLFTIVWLVFWGFSWTVALAMLFSKETAAQPAMRVFMSVWCLGWLASGLMAVFSILWQLCGREMVRAEPDGIFIRHEIFGIGRTRSYDFDRMSGLRTSPRPTGWDILRTRHVSPVTQLIGKGSITFDYGLRTIRFGAGISEAEARDIIGNLSTYRAHHNP